MIDFADNSEMNYPFPNSPTQKCLSNTATPIIGKSGSRVRGSCVISGIDGV